MTQKKATTIFLLFTLLFLVIAITGCSYTKEYITQIKYNDLKTKIENKDSFILFISNKSCPHCKDFQPKFQKIVNEYKIVVYKVDTATLTNDEYDKFIGLVGQTGTPTVMFFYDGVESGSMNRIDGDVENDVIIDRLKANEYIKS